METKRERLVGQATRLRNSIQELTSLAKATDVTALEKMHALCGEIHKDLTTKGSRIVPGGFNVRSLLQQVTTDALGDVKRKARATVVALNTARQQLAQVEAALKDFEQYD